VPVAFWTFQEPTGALRMSTGRHTYALEDGNKSYPIERVPDGLFGPFSAFFNATAFDARLRADRDAVPALTKDIAGPNATVSLVAWVKRPWLGVGSHNFSSGCVAGVWGDTGLLARQYALYFNLGACFESEMYRHGVAAHISDSGGATPGRPYCYSAACDPRAMGAGSWHCVANVYDGVAIQAYLNASLVPNQNRTGGASTNPYPYAGGIYSPEAAGRPGAEFSVGVSMAFGYNQYVGLLGGLAVWDTALTSAQLQEVCAWPTEGLPAWAAAAAADAAP